MNGNLRAALALSLALVVSTVIASYTFLKSKKEKDITAIVHATFAIDSLFTRIDVENMIFRRPQ